MTQLDDSVSIIKPSPETMNPTSTTSTASTTVAPTTNCPPPIFRIPPPKDNRKRRQEQAEEAYKVMKDMKNNTNKRDEFSVFGELVANKLRKCVHNPRSVAIAQHKINEILFNLEMEQFSTQRTTNIQSNVDLFVNAHGGQFVDNQLHSYYSPNTSASSSPSVNSDNAPNYQQQNINCYLNSSPSPPCPQLNTATNPGQLFSSPTTYPQSAQQLFDYNQRETRGQSRTYTTSPQNGKE